jgi:hypothetical protein
MGGDRVIMKMQKQILAACAHSLGRPLTASESDFVTCRSGFLALEAVWNRVQDLAGQPDQLAEYLNSSP